MGCGLSCTLQLLNVGLAEDVRVANELLAVEGGKHAVVQSFFMLGQLGEHSAQLEVVFAQVPQFEQLA